jgi:hypothetical protein
VRLRTTPHEVGPKALALACLLAGCAGGEEGEAGTPDFPVAPIVEAVEVLRLGSATDGPEPELFPSPPQVLVLPDEAIVASHARQGRVAVFDADGTFQRWIGARGSGPGEFQTAGPMGFVGNTIWIADLGESRLVRFLRDGTHLSTHVPRYRFHEGAMGLAMVTGYLQGGRVVADPTLFGFSLPAQPVDVALVSGLPYLEGAADTLLRVREPRGRLQVGDGSVGPYVPFGTPPFHAVAPDGSGVAVADWSDSDPGRLDFRFLAPDGTTAREWSLDVPVRPVSEADFRRVMDEGLELLAMIVGQMEASMQRSGRLREVPPVEEAVLQRYTDFPDHWPPLRELRVGIDGTIWMLRDDGQDTRPSSGGTPRSLTWMAFEPDGTPILKVTMPEGASVRQTSRNTVWGTMQGELNVSHVVRWDLRPRDP